MSTSDESGGVSIVEEENQLSLSFQNLKMNPVTQQQTVHTPRVAFTTGFGNSANFLWQDPSHNADHHFFVAQQVTPTHEPVSIPEHTHDEHPGSQLGTVEQPITSQVNEGLSHIALSKSQKRAARKAAKLERDLVQDAEEKAKSHAVRLAAWKAKKDSSQTATPLHAGPQQGPPVRRSARLMEQAKQNEAARFPVEESAILNPQAQAFVPGDQSQLISSGRANTQSHQLFSNGLYVDGRASQTPSLPPLPTTFQRQFSTSDVRSTTSETTKIHSTQARKIDSHPTQELWAYLNRAVDQTMEAKGPQSGGTLASAKVTGQPGLSPPFHSKAPEPTAEYLQQAAGRLQNMQQPQHFLIVLDLNGTLVDRNRGKPTFVARPNLLNFLQYCLQNHSVMIWSSAQPGNVRSVCGRIFTEAEQARLVATWARDKLDLTAQEYGEKVQVYKRLHRIWSERGIQQQHPNYGSGGTWNQTNTVLIDDSVLKGSAQPYNLIEIPEFKKRQLAQETKDKVLAHVVEYLENARRWKDVSTFIHKYPFREGKPKNPPPSHYFEGSALGQTA